MCALALVLAAALGGGCFGDVRQGRYVLYGAFGPSAGLAQLRIHPDTGALETVAPDALLPGAGAAVVVSPSGRRLYAADTANNQIVRYAIQADSGAVGQAGTTTIQDTANTFLQNGLLLDPAGISLYARLSNLVATQLWEGYRVDTAAGVPRFESTATIGDIGFRAAAVTPDGRFVYSAGAGGATPTPVVRIAPRDTGTGALGGATDQTLPFAPSDVAVGAGGRFLFIAYGADDLVESYAINGTDGSLTVAGSFSFPATTNPAGLQPHPGGEALYVAAGNTGEVHALFVDPASGAMTEAAGSPYAAAGSPQPMALGAGGNYLYVGDTSSGSIHRFRVQGDGPLVPLGTTSVTDALSALGSARVLR